MDALVVETIGRPVIKTRRKIPQPNEGEILIKVTVVGCKEFAEALPGRSSMLTSAIS